MKNEMPKKYLDLVGTKQKMAGALFSKKSIEPTEFEILDWRWGSGYIMDMDEMKVRHPTVQFLVKNSEMAKSRWTRSFPVTEIELDEEV